MVPAFRNERERRSLLGDALRKKDYAGSPEPPRWSIRRRTMPANPKVVHVALSLDVGGLERLVVDLVREGNRLGQQPSVVCIERPGDLADEAESVGAKVYCVYKRRGVRLGTTRELVRLFRKIQPDVVHSHQVGALFYAGRAARRTGVPVIVHTEHGKHYAQRLRTRWLGKWAGRYADRFCCVSDDIADEVRRSRVVPHAKIEVVANGIDVEKFASGQRSVVSGRQSTERGEVANENPSVTIQNLESNRLRQELGIPAGAPVIGTVGRLNEIKRQDVLIRAFARLAERRLDTHLVIVGEGALRGELEELAAAIAPASRVHFAGYQPDPERWLKLMDIFTLTSRSEGMPLSILEAWAAGVPVVASAVGGVPELIADGATGLLFATGDEAALSHCCERLLADRALSERLAGAGRKRVEREYSLARMAEAYQRLYRELFERETAIEQ